ncbi:hypothetical protein BVU_0067 [Phocaeicola vulgatus ATCC 8482]|uniref:Uncharacterized protein n=1 Tax=Phocaeicola vulgatus (strain ATCC 8482 / DSM 1447 / JCM 5826 / CCUG 4940 / NBRC 14291 / NCTC 11154) TaxID=435590 RepID=A6KWI3_PHOV8|nr:hypothetical protein BVU_0067 [Phocaeicola vulgatus ATCC 8482]
MVSICCRRFTTSQRFHISQSQIRHYIRLLSIIHIHSCYQSKRNNQSCLQNILLHLISSKKNYYYSYFHLILGKNSTAEKTKIPLAYSDYLHYFYIGLNLLFF